MDYKEGIEIKATSGIPTLEWFPEIKVEELISKYGPEGLYDIADLLVKRADEDVSDAMSGFSTMTKAEKFEIGYCSTCDTPNHKETANDCNKCNGYLRYSQSD